MHEEHWVITWLRAGMTCKKKLLDILGAPLLGAPIPSTATHSRGAFD